MTKKTTESQPFFHLLSELNAALPLEYAIRAARQMAPKEFQRLVEIDQRMRAVWREEGYVDELIQHDNLLDNCWDLLQFHYPEDRAPNRVYTRENRDHVWRVRGIIIRQFEPEVGPIDLPFADHFRVCDLLNGNDIPKLIREIFKKKDGICAPTEGYIPLSTFVLSVRRPIPRHRGSVQKVHLKTEDGSSATHIGLMLDPYMSLKDIDGALHEFLYHYAIFRRDFRPLHCEDSVTNELIMRWGLPTAPPATAELTQANELHTALNGLYCWDRQQHYAQLQSRGSISLAKGDVQALYIDEDGEDGISLSAINTHYQRVKKRIDELIQDELAWQESVKARRGKE
jgi:hypothetical protein